LKPTFWHLE